MAFIASPALLSAASAGERDDWDEPHRSVDQMAWTALLSQPGFATLEKKAAPRTAPAASECDDPGLVNPPAAAITDADRAPLVRALARRTTRR